MKIFPFFPDKFIKKGAHKTKAKSCRCQAFTLPNRVLDLLDWKRTTCTRSEAYDYVAAAEVLEPSDWRSTGRYRDWSFWVASASLPKIDDSSNATGFWQGLMGRAGDDQHRPLDTQVNIVTPENIEFSYNVAGPVARSLAFLLDLLFYFLAYILLTVVLGMVYAFLIFPALNYLNLNWLLAELDFIFQGLYMVGLFLGYWFYWGISESRYNGKTLGKLILGMRVVSRTGHPIGGWQAIARTFVRATEVMPLAPNLLFTAMVEGEEAVYSWSGAPVPVMFFVPTFLVAIICMTCSPRFQRIGDLVSGTMVVYEHRGWMPGLAELEDERTPHLAELIPPGFMIDRELARALAAYVHKRRYLTPLRRRDIARHQAEPLQARKDLQSDTSYDLFLCALYYRAFVARGTLAETSLNSNGSLDSGEATSMVVESQGVS